MKNLIEYCNKVEYTSTSCQRELYGFKWNVAGSSQFFKESGHTNVMASPTSPWMTDTAETIVLRHSYLAFSIVQ
jgi:hypothetical protein